MYILEVGLYLLANGNLKNYYILELFSESVLPANVVLSVKYEPLLLMSRYSYSL